MHQKHSQTFHFWEDEEKDYMLTDAAEIHFIEYPKFRKFADKNYKDSAIRAWLNSEFYNSAREKSLHDQANLVNSAEARGKEQGIQQGIKQGIQQGIQQGMQQEKFSIAKKLLMSRMSEDLVSNMTELNIEQVRRIKTELDIEEIQALKDNKNI